MTATVTASLIVAIGSGLYYSGMIFAIYAPVVAKLSAVLPV